MKKVARLVFDWLCCLQVVSLLLSPCLSLAFTAEPNQSRQLLVLGLGPVGRAVAKRALATANDVEADDVYGNFEAVHGTVRSPDENSGDGINKLLFSRENIQRILPRCTHALVTIPPQPEDHSLEAVWKDMEISLPRGAWVGFVSTTGVYGDHGGACVTEESPLLCEDNSKAAMYREAEMTWKARARISDWRMTIFRCAGIYGPGRSALHTVFQNGYSPEFSPESEKSVTNRVHEDDIARAIVASMISPAAKDESSFRVYNVADNEPENRSVVMRYAAQLLEMQGTPIKVKKQGGSPQSERSRRRGSHQKRVSNKRMRAELLQEYGGLTYPTYREGLESLSLDPSSPSFEVSR